MKILGVIPARSGSKSIKDKNIKLLSNKPLISYTIDSASKSNLTKIILSTDCKKIADVARNTIIEIPFYRPKKLANDNSSSLDVAIHALLAMEKLDSTKYDGLMLLQPTTPFRTFSDINNCIKLLTENDKADSVISVVDVDGNHPARMKYIKNNYLVDPPFCESYENQNRQELKKIYIRNGAIYLAKRNTILSRSFKGKKSLAYIMNKKSSINIDTIDDFNYAEYINNNYFVKNS